MRFSSSGLTMECWDTLRGAPLEGFVGVDCSSMGKTMEVFSVRGSETRPLGFLLVSSKSLRSTG